MKATDPIFIIPYSLPIPSGSQPLLLEAIQTFLDGWNAHGVSLKSELNLEDHQFITIAVNEEEAAASGCSKDRLYHFIQKTNDSLGLEEGPSGKFYIRTVHGIEKLSRAEIVAGLESGIISKEDALYPVWVSSVGQFLQHWKKPISQFSKELRLASVATNFTM